MPSTLRQMITECRMTLRDSNMRIFSEPHIIYAINEGKDELVKMIRQANENYFQTNVSRTISQTTTPNYSEIELPSDFSELRDIFVTTDSYEDISFSRLSQSDQRFKEALIDGGSFGSGQGFMFWDFMGESKMIFSPGSDVDIGVRIEYIKTIADMTLPDDYPTGIPTEHSAYMVTWAECELMRKIGDPRLNDYLNKLSLQRDSIIETVNRRQVKESKFVKGYMEEEYW